ncbi:MAG: tetratricopeptide repeat protein, partial [Chloroflexota bacterium]
EDRFNGRIDETLTMFHLATGEVTPKESPAIRESYLQAAAFVGREIELKQLTQALEEAVAASAQVWLVGGESGVGKSRLMDEFRVQALVNGWQVLTGQAVADGGLVYQLWQTIVPQLVLGTELSNLEAGVLQEMVPKLGQIFTEPTPTPPELTGGAYQERQVLTLVAILQRQQQPTLILLEDLQWAEESLAPVKQILKVLDQLSGVLVVGTYRNDERPELPDILPGAQTLPLERLDERQVAQLTQSMVGETNVTPELISLLSKQSEGNTFFIIEAMRALAEEAGRLETVGQMSLPTHILTSGMATLLQRRLELVETADQPLLALAAVAGRQIDQQVLAVLAPERNISSWLQRVSESGVLSVRDNQWLFSHDKLRESLQAQLSTETRQNHHRQVALALEQVYPEDATYHQMLLEHWHQAGNLDKEIHYLTTVAQYLIDIPADYNEAHRLLARSLPSLSADDARRVTLLNLWSQLYWAQGNYDQAQAQAQEAQLLSKKINDVSGLAASLHNMGNVAHNKSDYEAANNYYQKSFDHWQSIDDQRGVVIALSGLARVAFRQGFYEQSYSYSEQGLESSQALGDQVNVARFFNHLGVAADTLGNLEQARRYYLEGLKISQALGDQSNINTTLANLGVVEKTLKNYDKAKEYLEESLTICRAIGEQLGIAINLENLGGVAILQENYAQANDYLEQSMALSEKIGDQLGVATCRMVLGFLYLKTQDKRAKNSFEQALALSQAIQATPLILGIMVGYAWLYLQRGDLMQAGKLTGLAQYHPARDEELQIWLDELTPRLNAALSASKLKTAIEQGRVLELDMVVQELLNEFSTDVWP